MRRPFSVQSSPEIPFHFDRKLLRYLRFPDPLQIEYENCFPLHMSKSGTGQAISSSDWPFQITPPQIKSNHTHKFARLGFLSEPRPFPIHIPDFCQDWPWYISAAEAPNQVKHAVLCAPNREWVSHLRGSIRHTSLTFSMLAFPRNTKLIRSTDPV